MLVEYNDSELEAESKIGKISSLVLDLLKPSGKVEKICRELGYEYRDRVYTPMITVWLFISQILSKDHSCQQAAVKATAMASYQGKQTGETSLLRTILDRVLPGGILLADRYYATFWLLALGETEQIDLVARAHHLRKVDFRRGLKLGYLDQIVAYPKPVRPKWMSEKEYAKKFIVT